MEYYALTRNGTIRPSMATPNQCKDVGHKSYNYTVRCVFNVKKTPLDKDGFTVDHNDIAKQISDHDFLGSCEEMQNEIFKVVHKLLIQYNVVAYKCTLMPSAKPAAHLEFIHIADDVDRSLLALL